MTTKEEKDKHIKPFLKKLNDISDYILDETGIDVRLNTKSKQFDLPSYRGLFFTIALGNLNISLDLLGHFLNKDHSTVLHACKKWDELYHNKLGKYLLGCSELFNIGNDKLTYNQQKLKNREQVILDLKNIEEAKKENYKILQKIKKEKTNYTTNINNPLLKELLSKGEDVVNFVCETRIKPYLKMLESQITREDLIEKQRLTRTM